ncbi:thiol-disulfide oxidoreductase DCC family protein [Paenibacillus larvae]|nr:thiol-disulfide oxidoreductase DCC family protein [Paenibacillus larvae]MCY9689076.1 thiol-disulfide oxidoreductase DCC family protein [Paenibacillus larvae]MDR5595008.1 thiol-disulfide oxidoreductase DCC family protein [Paenibacillus larvae]PCK72238.1 hypothetical protein PL1_3225 [Paenibacillus larvae subsp. larvae B-3650]
MKERQAIAMNKQTVQKKPETCDYSLLLFDGACNLCSSAVQFIIRRDPARRFRFASLQSETGIRMVRELGLSRELNTLVLIEGGRGYTKSTAVLKIAGNLRQPWPWLKIIWIIPRFIRDFGYIWVSCNRYRWFGKKHQCMIPTPDNKERFINW